MADGCREPISTWDGFIIDGHNRYEICNKHDIDYQVKEMSFTCREEVIAWICKNQLGRRNITEETRKHLIGRQYESEKIANQKRNQKGRNQFSMDEDLLPEDAQKDPSRHHTAHKIANENNVTHATVQKYAIYTRALDTIRENELNFVNKVLSGRCKVSHKNLLTTANMDTASILSSDSQKEMSGSYGFCRSYYY